jgi:diguanylate cyclase (GGDEF)-like protein/PAS domain S-box-containing protein
MDDNIQNRFDVSILYVENESASRKKFSEITGKLINKLYLAKDGNEGLALFKENKPEIVVTNITLPYTNGIEMVRKMKAMQDDLPVIMTLARNDLNYLIDTFGSDISYYLLKPLDSKTLFNAIKRCAEAIAYRRQLAQQDKHIKELSLAVEFSPDIIIITNTDGIIEYINPKFIEITGYSKEEIIGKTLDILKGSDVDLNTYSSFLSSLKTGKEWRGRLINKKKNDECYWASTSLFPVKQQITDKVEHFICIQEDITNWKLTEEDLRISEEMFKVLAMLAQDAIVMVDETGIINFWNEAAEKMFLLESRNAVGKTLWDFIPSYVIKEIFESEIKHYKETCQCSVSGNILEDMAKKIDGTVFPIEISVTAIQTRDKCHSTAIIRDITERKRIEQAVLNEKAKFQTLSENAPFGIMLVDEKGTLLYVNPVFIEMFGYNHEEIPDGKTWFRKAFPEKDYRHEITENWIKDIEEPNAGKREPWVLTVTCKDKTQKTVDFYSVKLNSGESIVFCQDLTELKKNERKLLYITNYDALTGLPNRHSMEETLRQTIEVAKKGRKRGGLSALLFLDIDGFGDINAKLGPTSGDELLISTGKMLKNSLRGGDTVYRFGGDEFAIIFKGISMAEARLAAERIQRTINQHKFSIEYEKYNMYLSMGIIQIDGTMDMVTLLSKALNALYKAKKLGKNQIVVYQEE